MTRRAIGTVVMLLLIAATTGCAGHRHYRQGEIASQLGNHDEAVLAYMRAVETDPSSLRYESALMRAKIRASQLHFERGKEYREAGVLERALVELQQAVQLDPTNQYAEVELAAVRSQVDALRAGGTLETLSEIKNRTRGARPQPPVLDPRSDDPISLDFPEPTPIFQIYKALGDAFGINVLFDQNLKDQEISITLEEVTSQTALETLMRAAGHFYKVIDEHTILIAADTPQNRKTYEDLVIQTFFLSNAEVKEMMTILRSLIDSRRIAANEQLNAIILRDTADKVKVAERIIQANDKARAEVVVDVELLQIDTTRLRELGTQLSQYSVTQSLDLGGEDSVLRVSDLEFLNQSNWVLTIPNFIYNFVKRSSDAELLAQPRLRSSEGEKARAVIGDRVPIPVTSFNTANTVGSNIVPVTSFQYTDVGITIEIEPRVHHNQEITLQMRVEVSNISGFISGPGGQQQPRIGTRTIESTIRLRDGETNLIAGLIRTDESHGEQGLPGLSDLPVIGHLFGSKQSDRNRTDLILTLTPHIVRQAEITEEDLLPIWVGTEANITFRGGSPQLESPAGGGGPFEAPGTPEEVQELMRERIQRLPPGLREGQQGVEPEPPPGTDLVPGQRLPSSVFEEDEELQRLDPPPPLEEEPPLDEFEDGGLAALAAPQRNADPGAEPPLAPATWRTAAEAIAESQALRAQQAAQQGERATAVPAVDGPATAGAA
ncbi:MAG TPA: secretin N-terminal domain-containing protein, partial [Thermoanaerobaculia bacterium]|nr:secretin N-terminal domain-containing protein [Thermoanaerobaculia bacterium]